MITDECNTIRRLQNCLQIFPAICPWSLEGHPFWHAEHLYDTLLDCKVATLRFASSFL